MDEDLAKQAEAVNAAAFGEAVMRSKDPPFYLNPRTMPTIVCLCGSTRFSEAFRKANFDETLAGRIVLSIGCDTKSDAGLAITDEQKRALDALHFRKIEFADEVLVLNVDGYVGQSTQREVAYTIACGKALRWLEPEAGERYLEEHTHAIGELAARFALGKDG